MNYKNKHVFIIDSSIISANRIFSALGEITTILMVDYATNGKDALQKIGDNPPNAVLLDLQLPDINGADILQQIKKSYPAVIVIVLTDRPTNHSFNLCKKLGADGFYSKSNELDIAIKQIKNLTYKH